MKTTILKQSLILLSSITLLAACGADGGDSPIDDFGANPGESGVQSLLYAYPDNGQKEIATPAPVVLRFSSAVSLGDVEDHVTLSRISDDTLLAYNAEKVPGEANGVVLQPDERLESNTQYQVAIEGLPLARGPAKDQTIDFTTRALQRGPKSLMVTDADFELSRTFPNGSETEPVMDFSTFRFQFTQPIEKTSARYGQGGDATVTLTDGDGNLVDAVLLVDGPYMTVDPKPDHLDTSTEYTLTLGDGLSSTFEKDFTTDGVEITFTPKDSSPRGEPAILVQRITDSDGGTATSKLTGAAINQVPVQGTLLGENGANTTQAGGDVRAELADVTRYTEVTPVRIPRGTLLTGSNIDVMIGGEVPGGIASGAVTMQFLSDATGYLVPNPYAENHPDALRQVRLFMDMAISTEKPEANGGFTQDILHIELVGTAEVDPQEGVLNLDAVSVVEPDVLGQEFGYGVLSFQLQSYKDQTAAPKAVADTTPPTLLSWTLEDLTAEGGPDKSQMAQPTDPIVLNFDEPLNRQSVTGKVQLYKYEGVEKDEVTAKVHVDGAALVINPDEPLEYSKEFTDVRYELVLKSGITDLADNRLDGGKYKFSLPVQVEERTLENLYTGSGTTEDAVERGPYIVGLYPGYPCVFDPATSNLPENKAGRCLGGIPIIDPSSSFWEILGVTPPPADDTLPVPTVEPTTPIIVRFSKRIDPATINETTFQVEQIDELGIDPSTLIEGQLKVDGKQLTFTPQDGWQQGALYRYKLLSSSPLFFGSVIITPVACGDGAAERGAVCDLNGNPLQTRLLPDITVDPGGVSATGMPYDIETQVPPIPPSARGGPEMVQYFRGGAPDKNVLQVLATAPMTDVNANLIHEKNRVIDPLTPELHPLAFWDAVPLPSYQANEGGPTTEIDAFTDQNLDPNGVRPAANSAKILSTDFGIDGPGFETDPPYEFPDRLSNGTSAAFYGANVGCGFTEFEAFTSPRCEELNGFGEDTCHAGTPATCPEEKFTYLNSTLFAKVTDDYIEGKGLKIFLFPGKVVTTSFLTVIKAYTGANNAPTESGYQVMRMRYQKDDPSCEDALDAPCSRTQPIKGWIHDGPDGPQFTAENVELYLNAPELQENIKNSVGQNGLHNFYSYQVEMNLTGPVKFLDDGRMLIEQFNTEAVPIQLMTLTPETIVNLRIPERGSYLQYVSEPIK